MTQSMTVSDIVQALSEEGDKVRVDRRIRRTHIRRVIDYWTKPVQAPRHVSRR